MSYVWIICKIQHIRMAWSVLLCLAWWFGLFSLVCSYFTDRLEILFAILVRRSRAIGYDDSLASVWEKWTWYVELYGISKVEFKVIGYVMDDRRIWCRFMDNLQTEVLEIEFTEFSHGFKTISDLDFAEILLRYTDFDRDTKKSILRRVKKTATEASVSISLQQMSFFLGLN